MVDLDLQGKDRQGNTAEPDQGQTIKEGHKGLLTCDFDAKAEDVTTFRHSYKPPKPPQVRERGQ